MYVFRKIWHVLLSCYLCFESHPFTLLPTYSNNVKQVPFKPDISLKHTFTNQYIAINRFSEKMGMLFPSRKNLPKLQE